MKSQQLGLAGEQIATDFLQQHGFAILERQLETPFGEVDILARLPDGTIVYCEVRTRTSHAYGTPEESITPQKLLHMTRTAEYVQKQRFPNTPFRLDLLCVEHGAVTTHLQNIELA